MTEFKKIYSSIVARTKDHILANKLSSLLVLTLVLVCIGLSNHLWYNDMLFHTDLARDFLVLEEIVETKKPTLIGPRSGGIPGVFHGPLWYYLNLIPFIISQGNPVIMGWFWWLLGVCATGVFFFISKAITKDTTSSLLASLCYALLLIPSSASPVNNYIADLFSFVTFISWWIWYQKPSFKLAALSWFELGLLVQFQMAFAVPIIMLWLPVFIIRIVKTKQFNQVLSALFILPPLLTFFLFELRHDWLQVRSVLTYIQSSSSEITLGERVLSRITSASTDGLNIFALPGAISSFVIAVILYLGWKTRQVTVRSIILLLIFWYSIWWLLTVLFSGTVWTYYFSPFFGILLMCISLIISKSNIAKYIFVGVALLFFVTRVSFFKYDPAQFDGSSWNLLTSIAADALAQPERGYFLYSQDQFAYSLKYAFYWHEKNNPGTDAHRFEKKPETILVKAPDNPDNPHMTASAWQYDRIFIRKEPISIEYYPFGYQLELYELSEDEIAVPIDPNLILDLHFR